MNPDPSLVVSVTVRSPASASLSVNWSQFGAWQTGRKLPLASAPADVPYPAPLPFHSTFGVALDSVPFAGSAARTGAAAAAKHRRIRRPSRRSMSLERGRAVELATLRGRI